MQLLVIRQLFQPTTDVKITPDSECPQDAIEWLQDADFTPIHSDTAEQFVPDYQYAIPCVRKAIRELISVAAGQLSSNGRINKQALFVWQAPILRLDYEYGSRPYQCWLVGNQTSLYEARACRIYAPVSPLTEVVAAHVDEAIAHWHRGRRFKAAEFMSLASEMGGADPNCQGVLDRRSAEIPTALALLGKTQTKTRWMGGALVAYLYVAVLLVALILIALVFL